MIRKLSYLILTLFIATLLSCNADHKNKNAATNEQNEPQVDILGESNVSQPLNDTTVLKESHNEDDMIVNEYLTKRLKPIRENFKRINSINSWTSTRKKDLWETTEGGEATFYYSNGILEKIITRQFGETSQKLSEYYLLNGQLSFVIEKSFQYNRPIYYDSNAMKENNETEAFDFEKSDIIEDRSYFENGKLIHQLNSQDCGSPFSDDYLSGEQKRIQTYFDKLVKLGRN